MENYSIKITSTKDIERSFIAITVNGKRFKEYTGKRLGLDISPNKEKCSKAKLKLFKRLEFEFTKALDNGTYQSLVFPKEDELLHTTETLLQKALKQKLSTDLNPHYAKALERNCQNFLCFLTEKERQSDINLLDINRIQDYLDSFKTSSNNYMAKRRELGSLLGYIKKKGFLNKDLIQKTDRLKVKATLHQIYTEEQLHSVLSYLKANHENLYFCCLLSYGCLLRPHIEIRNLKGKHFNTEYSEIHLSGNENKSGKVRVTLIPNYVKEQIYERVQSLTRNQNFFTLTDEPFNEYYFKTAWSRAHKNMVKLGLLYKKQTIYSFRHTAAVNVYRKTKDLHILQQLLGHSDMIVTLKYLRGLGVHNTEELRNVMPEL